MEQVRKFILDAAACGVRFHIEGDKLKSRAPAGAISEDMAAFIRTNKLAIIDSVASGFGAEPASRDIRLEPRTSTGRLSLAQERFWFIHQLGGSTTLYNMPMAVRIRGGLDPDIAERALQVVVNRHAPLHSVYLNGPDGAGLQRPRGDTRLALKRIDLLGLPAAEQQAGIERAMRESAGWEFDLGSDLMLRGAHLRLAADDSVLLLCVHHIAADGWSFQVIEKEFVTLYRAYVTGGTDPLPPLRITYSDYIEWQRERLASGAAVEELAYWERQLAGAPPVHGVPLDHPRSERSGHQGARHGFKLDAGLHENIRRLAISTNTTVFMILHAAFALLLSRYSRSEDIVIGTPVLNRLDRELESLVGCFVNTLVLRVRCDASLTFKAFLQHVKTVNLDAQMHQEITFEQIVDHLNPPRSALHSPLFQIMFSMGMPQVAPHRNEIEIDITQLDHVGTTAKFDLSLYAQELAGDMYFGVEYNSGLFESATIECMENQYCGLLESIVSNPQSLLSALSMTAPDLQRSPPTDTGPSPVVAVESTCLHRLFERRSAIDPDAVAVVFGDQRLSYAQLNERANRLAHVLRARGVGPDRRIGVHLPRSLDLAIAILAIWKAGGAYVPLDPAYPAKRLSGMIEDAGVVLVLSHSGTDNSLFESAPQILALDADSLQAEMEAAPGANPHAGEDAAQPSDLAYVIFTSGSTGRPKGVMVEHASLINLGTGLQARLREIGIDGPCRWAWNASPAFDASLQALLQWAEGSALHLLPETLRRDPAALHAYLREERIDVLDATPQQIEMLLDCSNDNSPLPALVIGGEAIAPTLWARIAEHFKGGPRGALNVYGPTETTVDATAALIEGARPVIGTPLANVRCLVLDDRQRPQPSCVPGELYIVGAGLARGYIGRPDLTSERFVDLVSDGIGMRAYRTGDLARWLPGGTLEFLGRIDDQVKIRGYRIELAEIEHCLRQLPEIGAAAVVAHEGAGGLRELVAYIVPAGGRASADGWAEALRRAMRESLPDYMLPAHFVGLASLPLTGSGKLDRAALPPPNRNSAPRAASQRPATPIERLLAEVWAEQLKIDAIGTDDDFFEIGGNSILAARIVSRLSATLQLGIPLRTFFEHPTIAGLAEALFRLGDRATLETIAEVYWSVMSLDAHEVATKLAAEDGSARAGVGTDPAT